PALGTASAARRARGRVLGRKVRRRRGASSSRGEGAALSGCGQRRALLPVVLDLVNRAHVGCIGVVAELLAGAALAQQVPALVEFPFELPHPLALLRCQPVLALLAQVALLGDQVVDPAENA